MKIISAFMLMAVLSISLICISACGEDQNTDAEDGSVSITIENKTFVVSASSDCEEQYDSENSTQIVPMEDFENPIDFSDIIIFDDRKIKVGSLIYIPVLCDGLYDEYIYDLGTKSGVYMSGAKSLRDEYGELIADIQEHQQPFYLNSIVSVNEDFTAAIIRKSNSDGYADGKYLSGEYYILDFESGDCVYICDSYPNYSDTIPGTRIESIEWDANNSVKIYTYNQSDEFCIVIANKDKDIWAVTTENEI